MIKAVVFDFDGTLVDFVNSDIACLADIHSDTNTTVALNDFIERAVFHIMRFHELVDSDAADPLTMHHYRLVNTFKDFNIAWDDSVVSTYKAELIEYTEPYPGVKTILRRLYEYVNLGILTNADTEKNQRFTG